MLLLPAAYLWSFGDGSQQSTANPAKHTYESTEKFVVTLGVTDENAKTATITNTVVVMAGLAADFTSSPTNPAIGDKITFTANQTGGTPPFTYTWSFGDGSPPATGITASNVYAVKGAFVVTLTVTDSTNPTSQTVTVSHSISVNPQPLMASFMVSPNPVVSTSVTFTAAVSGGAAPYMYAWTFGDAGSALTNPASHTYTIPGTFTATLTVTDSNTTVTTASQSIIVAPPSLKPTFSVSANPTVASPITFTANSTGGTTPYNYTWQFGDGYSASGQVAIHTYSFPGSYSVTLTIHDSSPTPQSTNTTLTIIVSPDFTINISPTTLSFTAGQSATSSVLVTSLGFTGGINLTTTVSPSARGLITSFSANSASLTPGATDNLLLTVASAASTQAASYTVTVTGRGTGVPYRTTSINVTVRGDLAISAGPPSASALPPGASATLIVSVSSLGLGGPVFLIATASPVDGLTISTSANPMFLKLGGTGSFALTVSAATSAPTGRYLITVTATSGAIQKFTTQIFSVVPALSTPFFTVTPRSPFDGETISLRGSASGGVPPYNYTWSFGDGSSASGRSVTYLYSAAGNFIVTLTVTDLNGQTSQASTRLRVANPPDLADLSFFARAAAPVVTLGASVLVMISVTILSSQRKKPREEEPVQAAWQE